MYISILLNHLILSLESTENPEKSYTDYNSNIIVFKWWIKTHSFLKLHLLFIGSSYSFILQGDASLSPKHQHLHLSECDKKKHTQIHKFTLQNANISISMRLKLGCHIWNSGTNVLSTHDNRHAAQIELSWCKKRREKNTHTLTGKQKIDVDLLTPQQNSCIEEKSSITFYFFLLMIISIWSIN